MAQDGDFGIAHDCFLNLLWLNILTKFFKAFVTHSSQVAYINLASRSQGGDFHLQYVSSFSKLQLLCSSNRIECKKSTQDKGKTAGMSAAPSLVLCQFFALNSIKSKTNFPSGKFC